MKAMIPLLLAATFATAQEAPDLNALFSQASHYAFYHFAAKGGVHDVGLQSATGDAGVEGHLMKCAGDVKRWQFLYGVVNSDNVLHGAHFTYNYGEFQDGSRGWSEPIDAARYLTIEGTYLTTSLEQAVRTLTAAGYDQGFSQVTVTRPAPFDARQAYIFTLPQQHLQVAISTANGLKIWDRRME